MNRGKINEKLMRMGFWGQEVNPLAGWLGEGFSQGVYLLGEWEHPPGSGMETAQGIL